MTPRHVNTLASILGQLEDYLLLSLLLLWQQRFFIVFFSVFEMEGGADRGTYVDQVKPIYEPVGDHNTE